MKKLNKLAEQAIWSVAYVQHIKVPCKVMGGLPRRLKIAFQALFLGHFNTYIRYDYLTAKGKKFLLPSSSK